MQTERGNSALHDAAESGNVDVVKALISAGAQMAKDVQGVDPLTCAAQAGSQEVVVFLADQQNSGLRRRDALKLLGSTLLDKKMDAMQAMVVWRMALEVPLSHTEHATIRELETFSQKQEIYDNLPECQYVEDLDDLDGNIDKQRMQVCQVSEDPFEP